MGTGGWKYGIGIWICGTKWDASDKWRVLQFLMPDVRERCKVKLGVNHYGTQFLTGRGNFRSYLYRFGLNQNDNCKLCGVRDMPEHVLYECWKFADVRFALERELFEIEMSLDLRKIDRRKEGNAIFYKWIRWLGRIREEEQIHI